jgi:hypothetical protein
MSPSSIDSSSTTKGSSSRGGGVGGGTEGGDDDDARRRRGRSGGNWFLGLGWTLLALVVLDQALQYKQEEEAKYRRRLLAQMQYEADSENVADFDDNLPALFECKVRHIEASLDGTMMLTRAGRPGLPLRVGEVVEVVEANIGPNHAYHLCRLRPPSSSGKEASSSNGTTTSSPPSIVGWYPVEFLERI